MSFIAKIILGMILGDLAWWWRADRLLRPLPRQRTWRAALGIFIVSQIAGLALVLASRMHTRVLDALLSRALLSAVYLWHLMILPPVLIVSFPIELARGVVALARRLLGIGPAPSSPHTGLTRREFLGAAAAIAPAVLSIAGVAAAVPQLSRFRLRRIELPLASLPRALDGLTIAHVTDIHVGRFTHGAVLDEIVSTTNALAADLVLMTGDLINYALSDLPVGLDLVRQLRATHGVFMCEGNHDLIEDGAAFVRKTRAAGVPLLVDESTTIEIRGERVQLLGLPWGAPGAAHVHPGDAAIAFSARRLLSQRRDDAFPILLAHHPHAFDFAESIPLTLAGHTHGGQIMFSKTSGFGPWLFRYWSGVYTRAGRTLVVSNGVGNWFPLRTNAPAEIVHLTLRSGGGK
ncbi:MAG TPA: metallophosphoesterase [Chthoniobacteraceae bacterium]|nr:metallophosphoesterase [Chthoniobacteraceae bacterium]